MTNAVATTTTTAAPGIGDNLPRASTLVLNTLKAGLANSEKATKLAFTSQQQIALACILHHQSMVLNELRPVSWNSMVNKDGVPDQSCAAFVGFRAEMLSLVQVELPKLGKNETASPERINVVAQNKRNHANVTNGLAFAAALVACGVDDDSYDAKAHAFKVPLHMLCATGFKLKVDGDKRVLLDGTAYGVTSEGTGVDSNIIANVAQVKRALKSKAPAIVIPDAPGASHVNADAADTAPDAEPAPTDGTSATQAAPTATPTPAPGKSGAQPSTATNPPPPGDMSDLLLELKRIIDADSRARVVISDFTPKAWNALQALADFAHDVAKWTEEEAQEKAAAA